MELNKYSICTASVQQTMSTDTTNRNAATTATVPRAYSMGDGPIFKRPVPFHKKHRHIAQAVSRTLNTDELPTGQHLRRATR